MGVGRLLRAVVMRWALPLPLPLPTAACCPPLLPFLAVWGGGYLFVPETAVPVGTRGTVHRVLQTVRGHGALSSARSQSTRKSAKKSASRS